MRAFETDNLSLTDFMDLPTLQEIQDSFAAVANVKATITDAAGNLLTQAAPAKEFLRRQGAIAAATTEDGSVPHKEGGEYVAPIIVNNQRLGMIRMATSSSTPVFEEDKLNAWAEKYGIESKAIKSLAGQISRARDSNNRPAAIQFLFFLANAVARLCYQEFQLRQRINELSAVYNVATMLAEARNLENVLQRTVELVCEVMETKAASLRLLDEDKDELVIKAVHNLSQAYLNKGPVRMSGSEIEKVALSPQGYEYVQNMATDPRVHYPQESLREGVVSMLSVGMRYKGRPIGVLRVYTASEQPFSPLQIDLLKAVAAQAAAAIENARLTAEAREAENLEKQVKLAGDVQQRMIPQTPPTIPGLELASSYVPVYELGGDFFDFIELPGNNVGLTIADVSGKGVPASLIMASVRAALRAEVDNVYYLYEVIRRVNLMLTRDNRPSEFVTLFYGVLDVPNKRLTYCNAGHPPALLLRDGKIIELAGDNMVLGVDPDEVYKQHIAELKSGDTILMYTDGLPDSRNFQDEPFGRTRLIESFKKPADSAEGVAQNLLWDLRRFIGLANRVDDVTLIVARLK